MDCIFFCALSRRSTVYVDTGAVRLIWSARASFLGRAYSNTLNVLNRKYSIARIAPNTAIEQKKAHHAFFPPDKITLNKPVNMASNAQATPRVVKNTDRINAKKLNRYVTLIMTRIIHLRSNEMGVLYKSSYPASKKIMTLTAIR